MSFIGDILRNRERQQLEENIQRTPSPAGFLSLTRRYQADGELAKARQTARRGLGAFPADAGLAAAERELAALDREAEGRRLREQIENYPNARLYARLAELYRAGAQSDKASEVTRAGLHSFPNHGGLHYVQGLLHADAGDREAAAASLGRAAELDGHNYAALKLLGGLLAELGRKEQAVAAYAKILVFAPDDEDIRALHHRLVGGAPPAEEPAPAPAAAAARPAERPRPAARSALAVALEGLIGQEGIAGAVLADGAGLPVASALPDGMDEALAAAAAAELRKAASPACGEMGLGGFEAAVAESGAGGLYVYAVKEMTLAVFTGPKSRAGLVNLRARAFAGKVLGRS